MSVVELSLAAAALAVGSLLQGSIGFGAMVVAAPLLILVDTHLVPGPALFAATLLTALTALREHHALEWRGVGWAFAGRVPGTIAGGLAVAAVSDFGLQILFGVLLLAAVTISALAPPLDRRPPVMAGAGVVSGLMATTTSVGGPPIALLYQRDDGPTVRATLAGFFILGSAVSLATLAAVGEFGLDELATGLALTPGVVVGFAASNTTRRHLDRRSVRPWILAVSAASAATVLIRALA